MQLDPFQIIRLKGLTDEYDRVAGYATEQGDLASAANASRNAADVRGLLAAIDNTPRGTEPSYGQLRQRQTAMMSIMAMAALQAGGVIKITPETVADYQEKSKTAPPSMTMGPEESGFIAIRVTFITGENDG